MGKSQISDEDRAAEGRAIAMSRIVRVGREVVGGVLKEDGRGVAFVEYGTEAGVPIVHLMPEDSGYVRMVFWIAISAGGRALVFMATDRPLLSVSTRVIVETLRANGVGRR